MDRREKELQVSYLHGNIQILTDFWKNFHATVVRNNALALDAF